MRLTDAHDGIPPLTYPIAALAIVAAVGVFIALVARTARGVDCCPHPDLDDEDQEPAEVTS